jgi:hypothetical protein
MYMILYYDTRIREVIVKRWEGGDRVESMEWKGGITIPDEDIEPHESFTFKDPKIPISYKKAIAEILYNAESDVTKAEVRRQREAWYSDGTLRTVLTDNDEERLTLVRQYQKYVELWLRCRLRPDMTSSRNIPALSRNVNNVLRNVERKCAGKGITWVACPSPVRDGRPVGYL